MGVVLLVYLPDSLVLLLAFEGQLSLCDWIEEGSGGPETEYYETHTQDWIVLHTQMLARNPCFG